MNVKLNIVSTGRVACVLVKKTNTGRKVFGSEAKTTDYIGELVYENNTLQFASHGDGRVVMDGGIDYQYFLKDHLGNVRTTFATRLGSDSDVATNEPADAPYEITKFLRHDNVKRVTATLFDRTNGASPGTSVRLNGGTNEVYGLARSIAVMPGDVINTEVFVKYVDSDYSSNWTQALINLLSMIANNTGGIVVDGTAYGQSTTSFPHAGKSEASGTNGTAPMVYLNWVVFDNDMKVLSQTGFARISEAAHEKGTDIAHERLFNPDPITITEPGYVYIYFSNENETPVEAFFDDFKVEHMKSNVVQMEDYYPGGLTFNSYSRENIVPNKILFQEAELQDELDLGWYDFAGREYDPTIWRTPTQDPHAKFYPEISPYSFLNNSPVNTLDPTGMDAIDFNGGNGLAICPTCPNTPEFKPYIDDPNNTYYYDPGTGEVGILLPEVEVTADPSPSFASVAIPILMSNPQTSGLLTVSSAAASTVALTVALVLAPHSTGDGEMEALERMHNGEVIFNHSSEYIAPPKTLPGFPGAQRAKRKAGRARWINNNGDILEWDSQHGEIEVYDRQGNHKGAADPDTGEMKPDSKKPGRTTPK